MNTKRILGLDLGTNSIGWALVTQESNKKQGTIFDHGVRIIPMDKSTMGNFEAGNSISQTAERTGYRSTRKLYHRAKLRRERLHRVLNVLDFLPAHYADAIDFDHRLGQFKHGQEVKHSYQPRAHGKDRFIFKASYDEMMSELQDARDGGPLKKVPYDWTLYHLRKKALSSKIAKEELAWLILNFNQKRGYYQLRGEEEDDLTKREEFYALRIIDVEETDDTNNRGTWYNVHLENGFIYRRQSKESLTNWVGQTKEFIVTTPLEKDGTPRFNDDGSVKRSFRAVDSEKDWIAIKSKTEQDINRSGSTVGAFVFDKLKSEPYQKINGKLIRTIERKFYRDELAQILNTQIQYHPELRDRSLYARAVKELYRKNEAHRAILLSKKDVDMFRHLFMEDIIFYQRPLKSKKSTISTCPYEYRYYEYPDPQTGEINKQKQGVRCIAKSNPLYQEFRLWQFIHNLRVYAIDTHEEDVTLELFRSYNDWCDLYDFLNDLPTMSQKDLIRYLINRKLIQKKDKDQYLWNYVSDKSYPGNETRGEFIKRLNKIKGIDASAVLTPSFEHALWHLVYSVTDKHQFVKALTTFAKKNGLPVAEFVKAFKNHKPYTSDYGAYSEKAIKKLLPLMRRGRYWHEDDIDDQVKQRIQDIYERIYGLGISSEEGLTSKEYNDILDTVSDDVVPRAMIKSFMNEPFDQALSGMNTYQACYAVYERHAEVTDLQYWSHPQHIDEYLNQFKQHSLRNPIVEQVVTETLRTIRDLWHHHLDLDPEFQFDEIHLELGRDLKNSTDVRKKISEQQSKNEATNQRIKTLLEELRSYGARPESPSHQEIFKLYEEGITNDPDVSYDAMSERDVEKFHKNNSPTVLEITKYKLWLEQGYVSPYTGQPIPLSGLFSNKYQIEHIIPRSRYFDDSLSNKVICESAINPNPYKDNQTGMEFILNMGGQEVPELSTGTHKVRLFTKEEYEAHCTRYFYKNRKKLSNLLSEDVPDGFINRQMNDSRYISKFIKGLLSNIVRQPGEREATAKRLLPIPGAITAILKRDWGLHEQWNRIIQPRFERLNEITDSTAYGYMDQIKVDGKPTGTPFFRLIAPEGVNKKRIDHRHHVLDAIVLAACTLEHTQYLGGLNNDNIKRGLQPKLLIKNEHGHFTKHFIKPWPTFTTDTRKALETTIISFKKNIRVITKTNNKTWQYVKLEDGTLKKRLVKQVKGDSRAIRKALHKETIYGAVKIKQNKKRLAKLSSYLTTPELIRAPYIRREVIELNKRYHSDKRKIANHLKDHPILIDDQPVDKIEVWEWTKNATAARTPLGPKFTRKQLDSITDSGIRRILNNHVKNHLDDKGQERFDLAFDPSGIAEMNKNIQALNHGKPHQPIYSVRIYEEGSRFPISDDPRHINKTKKYVEAAKGTNLFFAIYWDEDKQKRTYETIPLIDVIEHQKMRAYTKAYQLPMIPIDMSKGRYLFHLSPNDLVYVPTEDEVVNPATVDINNLSPAQVGRIYKMVSCTGGECHFISNRTASEIIKNENGTNSKSERIQRYDISNSSNQSGTMIKTICWKLTVNRIGQITKVKR